MTNRQPNLAELIGSRICHDLISPIGAINNGIELLGMSNDASGPEIDLINESVENASARIRFFRLAFGAAGAQKISAHEIRTILRDVMQGSKLTVQWDHEADCARQDVRLAFLAKSCLESAMPYGGQISMGLRDGAWLVSGQSSKFKADAEMWSILGDGEIPSDIQPAQVQFALLATHARDEARVLTTMMSDGEISIQF